MSDTYIGWDGKPYPWPPPEGWYHASDGRWWAPDTGPNPPQHHAPSVEPSPPRFDQEPTAFASHTAEYLPASDPQQAGTAAMPNLSDTGENRSPTIERGGRREAAGYVQEPHPDGPYGPANHPPDADYAPPAFSPSGEWSAPREPQGAGRGKVIAAAGVAALAVIAAVGFFLAARGGDETATDASGTTTALSSTAADATVATSTGGASTTGAVTGSSPSDQSTSTSIGSSSTTADAGAAEVASFRNILRDNGLTSDQLTDTEIKTFGSQFCIFAQRSNNPGEFAVFREQALAETVSNLKPESLNKVIDAAIVTFCPDEATRLGISV